MLRQMHILDTIVADLILQGAYIANVLVNSWGLPSTFYKMVSARLSSTYIQAKYRFCPIPLDSLWVYPLSTDVRAFLRLSQRGMTIATKREKLCIASSGPG